jgi:glyoxylase-like metal-dependent hydrolase (beta-lactamase superfamily II)
MNATINQLDDRTYQIKVPLPFPLQWVNAYAIRGEDGWTVIDPGLHTPQAEERWEEAAKAMDLSWNAVEAIVLTHHHPDHYGMAGWFQQRTAAPVLLSQEAHAQANKLWGEEAEQTAERTLELFIRHGLPQEEIESMEKHLFGFIEMVSPQPDRVSYIAPGSTVRLGVENYEAILTEGHASGHLSFLNRNTGRIFCGDHVLPGITPNVSYLPGGDPNPLKTYISGLNAAMRLPVAEALPGHREPFKHFAQRCADIIKHHEDRLTRMSELRRSSSDAYTLCRTMFGNLLSTHQLRFALSETIAHLIYLDS